MRLKYGIKTGIIEWTILGLNTQFIQDVVAATMFTDVYSTIAFEIRLYPLLYGNVCLSDKARFFCNSCHFNINFSGVGGRRV